MVEDKPVKEQEKDEEIPREEDANDIDLHTSINNEKQLKSLELTQFNSLIQKCFLRKTHKLFFYGVWIFIFISSTIPFIILYILNNYDNSFLNTIIEVFSFQVFFFLADLRFSSKERSSAKWHYYWDKLNLISRYGLSIFLLCIIVLLSILIIPMGKSPNFWYFYFSFLWISFGLMAYGNFLFQELNLDASGRFFEQMRFFNYHLESKNWSNTLQFLNKVNDLCRRSRVKIANIDKIQFQVNDVITNEIAQNGSPGRYSNLYANMLQFFNQKEFRVVKTQDILLFLHKHLNINFQIVTSSWPEKWLGTLLILFSPSFVISLLALIRQIA